MNIKRALGGLLIGVIAFFAANGLAEAQSGQHNDKGKAKSEIERYYRGQTVKVKREVPYLERAIVISKDNSITVQPVDDKVRVEELFAAPDLKYLLYSIKVTDSEVILKIRDARVPPRPTILGVPPINPNDPPWDPGAPIPQRRRKVPAPFKRSDPVHFSVVIEYSRPSDLSPERLNDRLEPVLKIVSPDAP